MRALVLIATLFGSGIPVARAQSAVALDAVTDHRFYRETADSQVFVEARVTAAAAAGSATASIRNVVLVLDRSGSMAGGPIEALRAAAMTAVGDLSDGDFISVLAFGSEVETLIEAQPRNRVRDFAGLLAHIEPAGGAALYDALNHAAAQVRRNATPATINQIILVTDGPPTKGPRELEDFTRLAEIFSGEGIALSTVGLGLDFNEDVLAAMARVGHGGFQYAAEPAGLAAALRGALAPARVVMGYDAELAVEFSRVTRKPRSHAWRAPTVDGRVLRWRFPRLLSGQPLSVLASAEVLSFQARMELPAFATVTLRWKNPASGETDQLVRIVPIQFSRDSADIRETLDTGVARTAAAMTIREGLERAINEIDGGNPRRAVRLLRDARAEVRDINFDLEDVRIIEMVRRLDGYLAEVQARPFGPLDRKILRSGLRGEFDPPAEIMEPGN